MDSKKTSSKDEDRAKKELEYLPKIKEIETKFREIKIKKENLFDNFTNLFQSLCEIGCEKIKTSEVIEELYLTTARMIEFALTEKDFDFQKNLKDNEKSYLIKFYYSTYDRISQKKNTLSLKPAKIYNAHYNLIKSSGIGGVHRALFSIQK